MKILIEESVLRQALETFTHCYAETDRRINERAKILVELRTVLDAAEKAVPVAWLIPGSLTQNPDLAKSNGDYAIPLYPVPAVPEIDCAICTNRGRIYMLSQESNCDHCLWQGHWHKKNLYAAPKPEESK